MATTSHITDHLFKIEDNRLASVVDENNLGYYAYDHSVGSCGSRVQSQACLSNADTEQRRQCQRVLKLTWCKSRWLAQRRLERFNANMSYYHSIVDRVTLYTSPYLVANSSGYTKHYYAGSERICARLGNGNLSYHQTQSQPFIGNDQLLEANSNMLFNSVLESMSERGLNDNSQLTISALCNNNSDPLSVDMEPAPIEVAVATTVTTAGFSDIMEYFATQTQQNESPYFYHGDHLGSASWITDASGIPVQHLQYLPFGEPFVNQHTSGYKERFTFTGKERDEETGFGYFGARYMDHELMTMWLSVDPMADKYPSISPYAYCAWNPVKLVDPDGEEISTHTDHEGNVVAVFDDGDNGVYRHGPNRDGSAVTEYQITKRREKYGTSARGEYMGQTKYWDEFMTHDGHSGEAQNPGGRILFGESWEETIANYNAMSNRTGLEATAIESHPGGVYDIKQNTRLAPDGVLTGKMLEGYYVSAESAGNYLAGLNGATGHWGLLNNHTVSKELYMLLAGMLHSKANNTPIVPPYYGEIEYAGRWISYGFSVGEKIRNGK